MFGAPIFSARSLICLALTLFIYLVLCWVNLNNGTFAFFFQTADGETGDLILKGHNGPIIDFDLSQTDEVISALLNQT